MARSLTIQQEETPTTSPLLTGFLAFVILWMLLGTLTAASAGSTGVEELPVPEASLLK